MEKEEELKVGDRVYHKKYGKGTIVEIDFYSLGQGFPLAYLVEFDNANKELHHYNSRRDWLGKSDLTKLERIVIKDIDGEERTYDLDLGRPFINWIGTDGNGGIQVERISQTSEYEPAPEPDKPQEIKVKIGDKTIYSNIERKEEKINMENRVNSILDIYERNRYNELDKEFDEQVEKITHKDEIEVMVKEFEKTLTEKFKKPISVHTLYKTEETEKKIKEADEQRDKKATKLRNMINEVKAQIRLCDTYDQVIDILVSYGIIDKKTKKIN